MAYYAYMMASASGVLYIGVTRDIERRVAEHKGKAIAGFSRLYNTTKLVYFEAFDGVRSAIAREKQWKGWRRSKKVFLIELTNPKWEDLRERFHCEKKDASAVQGGKQLEKKKTEEVPPLRSE